MSEDNNKNNNNDAAEDAATLKERLEQVENEKAALEMKLKKSDDDLYSDDYLAFLQEQKKKQPSQSNLMSGGRLTDYSDDEIQGMPVTKLVGLIRNDVYSQIREEEETKTTRQQRDNEKKRVSKAREEIKAFAGKHPDFKNYVAKISELSDENPNLKIEQLYVLAGGKLTESQPTKQEASKSVPNTRATVEAGVKQSDKSLSLREVIAREYQKLK